MLSLLASLLLFGAAGTPSVVGVPAVRVPGIEVMQVSAPAPLAKKLSLPPTVSASGVLLLDLQSGQELLSRHPDQRRPMASLTKIMTALLILERHNLQEIVLVPAIADQIRGSTIGVKPGERFTIGSLLKALLIPSANDIAYTLAISDSHSVAAFVLQMNTRAQSLGLTNTHFLNPAGLDNPEQYSSPRDLGWLTIAALRNPDFSRIVALRTARIADGDGREFDLRNTNDLLQENEHVSGVKTGTTEAAGECLIVRFEEQGHPYLLILLGSRDRYTDSLYILQAVQNAQSR